MSVDAREAQASPDSPAAPAPARLHFLDALLARFVFSPAGVGLLEAVSLCYVGAPILIFIVGWLRPAISVWFAPAFALCLAWSGIRALRWAQENYSRPRTAAQAAPGLAKTMLFLLCSVAFCVACTGVGRLTFQFADYWVYDGHLRELMTYSWPLGAVLDYPTPDIHVPGATYWAYWLPSAVVGRLFGWNAGYFFQFPWNALGVLLAVAWFLRIVGTWRLRFALLFLFFGGIDLIGYVATTPLPNGIDTTWFDYLTGTFWWSIGRGWMAHWGANFSLLTPNGRDLMNGVFYRFYGTLAFLFDGPHHVLPEWVLLLMVLHDALRRKTIERLFFLTSILPLCSIFVTVGAIPLLILAAVHTRLRGLLTIGNMVLGPILVLFFALYYRSVESHLPNNFLWQFQDIGRTWPYLILYYISAFLIYAAVAPSMRANGYRPGRPWFYTALAVFLLAPWYRMGVYNDFTTKVVVPCQLIFLICLATSLRDPAGPRALLRKRLLVGALILGAWSGSGVVMRALDYGFSYNPPPMERAEFTIDTFNKTTDSQITYHPDNFFWKHLARPVQYLRVSPNTITKTYDFAHLNLPKEDKTFFTEDRAETSEGLVLHTEDNKPLIRVDNQEIDTRTVGDIKFEHTIVDEAGNVPKYSIIFQWAGDEEIKLFSDWWPFHRWRATVIYPTPDPRQPISTNPYWRGIARDFTLYFKVEGGAPGKKYTVTMKKLIFYQR